MELRAAVYLLRGIGPRWVRGRVAAHGAGVTAVSRTEVKKARVGFAGHSLGSRSLLSLRGEHSSTGCSTEPRAGKHSAPPPPHTHTSSTSLSRSAPPATHAHREVNLPPAGQRRHMFVVGCVTYAADSICRQNGLLYLIPPPTQPITPRLACKGHHTMTAYENWCADSRGNNNN